MKILMEIDLSGGPGHQQQVYETLARLFGTNVVAGNGGAPAPLAPAPAPGPAPSGAMPPPAPAPAAPSMPPVQSMAPLAPSAPTMSAPPPPPAAATAPGAITSAQFSAQVNAFAEKYRPAETKKRFAELAKAYGQPTWVTVSAIPADKYEEVIQWFRTE